MGVFLLFPPILDLAQLFQSVAQRGAEGVDHLGRRHQRGGGVELAPQAVDVVLVLGAVLGVATEAVVPGAAGEERALVRVRAGQAAVRNRVAVHVEVAVELEAVVELLARHHLAAVRPVGVVPGQRRGQPVVHAKVKVAHHQHRRLQPLGKIERLHRHVEAFLR